MIKYPKGARWYVIANGECTELLKTKTPKGIKELFFDSPMRKSGPVRYVVVQPRGKQKWWLFGRYGYFEPRFLVNSREPTPLIMRAVLGADDALLTDLTN